MRPRRLRGFTGLHQRKRGLTKLLLPFGEVGEAGLEDLEIRQDGAVSRLKAGVEGGQGGEVFFAVGFDLHGEGFEVFAETHLIRGEEGFGEG